MKTSILTSLKEQIEKLDNLIDILDQLDIKNDKNYKKGSQLFNDLFKNKNVDCRCSVDQDLGFALYKFTDKLDLERECSINGLFLKELMNGELDFSYTDPHKCYIIIFENKCRDKDFFKGITIVTKSWCFPMPNIVKDQFRSMIINEAMYLLMKLGSKEKYTYSINLNYKGESVPTKCFITKNK